MAKEISGYIKLQIMGGQANPAPPVGPALGQRGINIMEFCKAFNDKTKAFAGKGFWNRIGSDSKQCTINSFLTQWGKSQDSKTQRVI